MYNDEMRVNVPEKYAWLGSDRHIHTPHTHIHIHIRAHTTHILKYTLSLNLSFGGSLSTSTDFSLVKSLFVSPFFFLCQQGSIFRVIFCVRVFCCAGGIFFCWFVVVDVLRAKKKRSLSTRQFSFFFFLSLTFFSFSLLSKIKKLLSLLYI